MKKILAALLILALVAPAMAAVSVTAQDSGNGVLTITVTPSAGAGIRGVALALTRNSGNGEVANSSKVTTTGLNTFIDYGFSVPAGFDVNVGHAAANIAAAGVATFPAQNLSLCAGYLAPSAQAALTTPAVFTVDYDGTTNTTIGIALDTLRGGIVGDNLGAITVQASQLLTFAVPETITGTLVFAKTTAAPAINTRVNGGRVETFTAAGVAGSLGGALEYQFNWGDGSALTWGTATQNHTYTYTAAQTYNVSVKVRPVSNPAAEVTSPAVAMTTEPVKYTAAGTGRPVGEMYADLAQYGRPVCWAYARNCNGDVNGTRQGNGTTGYVWVSTQDLSVFLAAYGVKELPFGVGIMNVPGYSNAICADFNHLRQGNSSTGYVRVSTNDLSLFLASYGDKEPGFGPGVPVCAQTNYHYWTGGL